MCRIQVLLCTFLLCYLTFTLVANMVTNSNEAMCITKFTVSQVVRVVRKGKKSIWNMHLVVIYISKSFISCSISIAFFHTFVPVSQMPMRQDALRVFESTLILCNEHSTYIIVNRMFFILFLYALQHRIMDQLFFFVCLFFFFLFFVFCFFLLLLFCFFFGGGGQSIMLKILLTGCPRTSLMRPNHIWVEFFYGHLREETFHIFLALL